MGFPRKLEVDETLKCTLLDANWLPRVKSEYAMLKDIVRQNYIKDTSTLVLRIVYYWSTFSNLYYIPVNRSNTSDVRIYIRRLWKGAKY